MKKFVAVSLLAASATLVSAAQTPVNVNQGAQQQSGGDVQLSQAEYNDYTAATQQTDPKAKAAALEAFLTKYPSSTVKNTVLELLMGAYSQFDANQTVATADKLLQVDPNNIRAIALETGILKNQADQTQDAAQKADKLAKSAEFAKKGLALTTPPKGMTQADFDNVKKQATPYFYSSIGADAIGRKDFPAAIAAYEAELKSVPEETTKQPAPFLQDTYFLGQAYYFSTPPDLLKCSFYATRTATFAPDQFKATFQPLASYCYKKFHGGDDGYDAIKTAASSSVLYPDSLTASVKPAPTPQDFVNKLFETTPDLTTLNISDREFVIQNGKPEDAEKVFTPVKGKEVLTSGKVVSVTDTDVMLAVSEDSKQANPPVADFDFKLKEPLKKVPAVGDPLDIVGTYDSYTQKPLLITMTGAYVQEKAPAKKAPAKKAPVRRKK